MANMPESQATMATMPEPLHVMVATAFMAATPESPAVMAATPEATKAVPKLSKLVEANHESPMHSIDSDMTTVVIYELTVTASRF